MSDTDTVLSMPVSHANMKLETSRSLAPEYRRYMGSCLGSELRQLLDHHMNLGL